MRAEYHERRSKTGLRLAIAHLPESECAAVSVNFPVGSRDDPPGRAGLAHFVEHILFKGSETRDARSISLEVENMGASLNAQTSEDQTSYEGRGDAETLPVLTEVLADMIWQPRLDPADIELEREVIAEEIVMYDESPCDLIGDLISAALWPGHPLGQPIPGTLESLARIDRPALAAFLHAHYRRADLVIGVAGPLPPEEVEALLNPLLPEPAPPLPSPVFPGLPVGESTCLVHRDTRQIQLALAYPCFGRHDPRRHALRLLAMILGEGSGSRLFLKLREDRGLCYHVSCDITLLDDTGAMEISAGLDSDSRALALELIAAELNELAVLGPGEEELARAKRLAISQHRAAMESTASHAAWAVDCLLQHQRLITPGEALTHLMAVDARAVRDVAHHLLSLATRARAEILPQKVAS